MSARHPRQKAISHGRKHPIPGDPVEQVKWASGLAPGFRIPAAVLSRGRQLKRQQRVTAIYPVAVAAGAEMTYVIALVHHQVRDPDLSAAGIKLWACTVATGIPIPPTAAFTNGTVDGMLTHVWHAGVQRGSLLALESLGLREKGSS